MPATPWSSSGSLVSDRLPPRSSPLKQQTQNKSKGKNKTTTPEPPKSQAVSSLEARLDGARGLNGRANKDPKGGCFCQARTHALSSDVPMCRRCGLILCVLNPAHYACPHCSTSLLDDRARAELIKTLERELTAQIAQEEEARRKAIEEARAAEGAFPTLPGSRPQAQTGSAPGTPATRTVLSLSSETGRVKVSSYSTPTAVTPRSLSRAEDREDEGRVPGPPMEVSYVKDPVDPGRPWRSVRVGDVRYVPLPGEKSVEGGKRGRKRREPERGTASGPG